VILRLTADIEMIDLYRSFQHGLASNHQTVGMSHPPSRRLADIQGFSQSNRGHRFVRLQNEPHAFQPHAQGKPGGVQRRARCRRKLEAAVAIGALIKTRTRSALSHVTPGDRDGAFIATRRAGLSAKPSLPPDADNALRPRTPSSCRRRFGSSKAQKERLQTSKPPSEPA